MAVLHPSTALQDRPFDHDPAFPVADLDSPAFAAKMAERIKRSGLLQADFLALVKEIRA
jgi:alpha-D-ribose 1-methylphosphonate 5-triphosphate diphosphatase